jgi:hypothetical protein
MSEAKDKGKQVSKVPRGPYAKENRPHGTKSDHRKTTDVPRDRNYFLKYPQSVWYEQAKELPSLDSNEMLEDENRILKLKEEAKQLYETLSEEFDGSTYCSILPTDFDACSSSWQVMRRESMSTPISFLSLAIPCPVLPLLSHAH